MWLLRKLLLQVMDELKEAAASRFTTLKIVEIPDGVDYYIENYDGKEHVAEKHRIWY